MRGRSIKNEKINRIIYESQGDILSPMEEQDGKIEGCSLGHSSADLAYKQLRIKEKELKQRRDLMLTHKSTRLSHLVLLYLDANKNLRSSTKEIAERVFSTLIEVIGNITVSRFCLKHALIFQNWAIQTYKSKATVNCRLKMAKSVFNWAFNERIINVNPFIGIDLFPESIRELNIVSKAEFQAMLRSCPNKLWQCRLMLARTAGLRRNEILNLTRDDVDFRRNIINIKPKRDTANNWDWQPKKKDIRKVPLVPKIKKLLIENIPNEQLYLTITIKRYQRIIQLKNQGILPDRVKMCPDENFKRPYQNILKRSKIKNITINDLRRTCINEWFNSGMPINKVMKISGFSDVRSIIKIYRKDDWMAIKRARLVSDDCLT